MEKRNVIKEKSFLFAIEIVDLYKLLAVRREFVLSKQLLRSGTSIVQILENRNMRRVKQILYINYRFH
jgi:four helix bundle protein